MTAITESLWTDERVRRLKRLWLDGLSAAAIANELGNVTRNAVIGKVSRLGLNGRGKSSIAPEGETKRITGAQHSAFVGKLRQQRAPTRLVPAMSTDEVIAQRKAEAAEIARKIAEPQEVDETVIPVGQRCTLLELNDHKCRWPIGEPAAADFFFCGGKPMAGTPYCGYHTRLAYQPAVNRRRADQRAAWEKPSKLRPI